MNLSSLILLPDIFIVEIISVKLSRMIVVIHKLIVSVDLICESAFLDKRNSTAPSLMSSTGVWQ